MTGAQARELPQARFPLDDQTVVVEVLSDRCLHLWMAGEASGVSPMVDPRQYPEGYPGPSQFRRHENGLTTAAVNLVVSDRVVLQDMKSGRVLVSLRPSRGKLFVESPTASHLFGLGEQFLPWRLGQTDGDWLGEVRFPGASDEGLSPEGVYGNRMVPLAGGAVGNAQFPILYALCEPGPSYSLFLDDTYRQRWDFSRVPWVLESASDSMALFLTVGEDLRSLRRDYMELTGRPPVPPRKAFGLWVSEYGFENWEELFGKLRSLRDHHFPLDGFVLDLQWFGGIKTGSEDSSMGRLEFDTRNFPKPAETVRNLAVDHGLGLMTIEEAYISKGLPEHYELGRRGHLVRGSAAEKDSADTRLADTHYINESPWWGLGGMLDYTDAAGAAYWHDTKRQKLVEMGVLGHWTDLGEPEMFNHLNAAERKIPPFYDAGDQARVNNLFALAWARSIVEGYRRHGVDQRPFILGRTGTSGIQRYGVALWSGDIGANSESLATHYNAQMHLAMSGVDYFGSDIGGFHRGAFEGSKEEFDELYTRWFAAGCLTDVPIRPHTENLANTKETAPDRVGDLVSNRENLRLRYRLVPYYYSLAHQAYREGDPVVAPIAYWFPNAESQRRALDPDELGDHKMIGEHLLGVVETRRDGTGHYVYLPPGKWTDFHTGQWHYSRGTVLRDYPLLEDGLFRLPLFAREGAIVPMMHVDEQTMNAFGRRLDGSRRDELLLRVVPSAAGSQFTLYEDDGTTLAYQRGEVGRTVLRQQLRRDEVVVTVEPREGSYRGAPEARECHLEVVLPPGVTVQQATLNDAPVEVTQQGGMALLRSAEAPVSRRQVFRITL